MFRIDRTRVSYVKAEKVYVSIDSSTKPDGENAEPLTPDMRQITEEKRAEAEKLLEDARQEAARVGAAALAEKDTVLEQAFREGFEKGQKDGAAVYQQLCEQLAESVKNLMEELQSSQARQMASFEEGFVDLVFSVAEKVLRMKLDRDDGAMAEVVRGAMAAAGGEEKLTVMLSAEDCGRLFPEGYAHYVINNENVTAAVVEKPEFRRGDCVVENEGETIDAGIHSQLRVLEIAFKKEGTADVGD